MLITPLDEGADGRGRGVEDGDFVVFDDLPCAVRAGSIERALIHDGGDAILQRAVDNIGVAGDPADVGGTPEDVVGMQVEDVFAGEVGLHGVAASGVEDALWLTGGARSVEDVERIFGVEFFGGAVRRGSRHKFVPPEVTSRLDGDVAAGALVDDHVFHERALLECFIDDGFEGNLGPTAPAGVLSDNGVAFCVVDAVDQCVCCKTAEDDGVDGTDACAGQEGNGELRDHAHVNGDAVAFADALLFEDIGELLYFGVELTEGESADFAVAVGSGGFSFPEDGDVVALISEGMAIDTVVAEIQLAACEPGGVRKLPVENLAPGCKPVKFMRSLCPETFRVLNGAGVQGFVSFHAADARFLGEGGRRWKNAVLPKHGTEVSFLLDRNCGGTGRVVAGHALLTSLSRLADIRPATERGASALPAGSFVKLWRKPACCLFLLTRRMLTRGCSSVSCIQRVTPARTVVARVHVRMAVEGANRWQHFHFWIASDRSHIRASIAGWFHRPRLLFTLRSARYTHSACSRIPCWH